MAITLGNRIKVSTSTTGTGTITLGSAETGYQTFANGGISNGDEVRFVIEDGTAFEISKGTYTHSGTTLSRTLLESTTGALLNLSGSAKVFVTAAADDLMLTDGGTFTGAVTFTDDVTLGSGPYYARWDDSTYAFIIDKNAKLAIGDGASTVYDQNFMIYASNVNNTYVNNQVGSLNISNQGDGDVQIEAKGQFGTSKKYFLADYSNYEAQLFYNGSQKLATKSTGCEITGDLTASGKIGLDTTDYITFTGNTQMDVYINGSNEFRFEADGDFHADGNVIAYSTTVASDAALKENIQPVTGLESVMALDGVSFDWKRDGKKSAGVIAQQVQKIMPEAVTEVKAMDGSKHLSVNYNALTSMLVEAIKDLKSEIEVLKNALNK